MPEPTTPGAQFLQRLIRHAMATPGVTGVYVGGALAAGGADPFLELDLYLIVPGGLDLAPWVGALGESAYAGITPTGCQAVTPDGLTVNVLLNQAPPAEAQTVLQTAAPAITEQVPGPGLDTPAFWNGLYQAAAALGRQQVFTAHGRLEQCRAALLDLYRLALTPGGSGAGWEGLDGLPGAGALDGLKEWLVAPLDLRAQWRSAHRMATTYERLVLPLTERLGLSYPWAMRNLAFERLDQIRPDRPTAEVEIPKPPADPEPPRTGPAKFKIRRRSPEQ